MKKQPLSNILFLDIECVPQHSSFFDLDPKLQELRERKGTRLSQSPNIDDDAGVDDLYENRSGIYAEFGKVIVISVGGFVKQEDGALHFRLKSFAGDDEKRLLQDFFELINTHYYKPHHCLCGHNVKEFDIPYICRRATVHGLDLPSMLDLGSKKPWEVNHLDTMEMRKFGDRKNYCSLDLLCRVMGIETPKTDISGEQVASVYWKENDLERIKQYCERDVVAVGQLLLKFMRSKEEIDTIEYSS